MLREKKSLVNRTFAFDVDFYYWFPLWSDSNDNVVVVKFLSLDISNLISVPHGLDVKILRQIVSL